jgi:hypothetical protein
MWRLWDEIKSEFSDIFEFHHSWGLGVVRKPGGDSHQPLLDYLFAGPPAVREHLRRHYVIYASHLENLLRPPPVEAAPKAEPPADTTVQIFPCIEGSYQQESSRVRRISMGEWNTISFELSDPKTRGPIRIDPATEPCFIEVGDILIYSCESGNLLWSSLMASDRRDFQVAGTARSHPTDASLLISAGPDPVIVLNTGDDVRAPLRLTLSLRVTPLPEPALSMIQERLECVLRATLTRLQQGEQEQARLSAALNETIAARDEARAETAEARAALEKAQQRLTELEKMLAGILDSQSWKLTQPLRTLMSALRAGHTK